MKGLKVNAAKSFFCTHEIEYLGYILTRGGFKPQQKPKVVFFVLLLYATFDKQTPLLFENTDGIPTLFRFE